MEFKLMIKLIKYNHMLTAWMFLYILYTGVSKKKRTAREQAIGASKKAVFCFVLGERG